MIPAREGLLSTVRALMEMTEARGCTRAEAAIAGVKARQLMEKHGISLKELAESASNKGVYAPAVPAQESSQPSRDYKYRSGAFGNETFARRGRGRTWEALKHTGRSLAGYAGVGFGIWAIAAFHITPSQQEHPFRYSRGISNAEEPAQSEQISSQDRAEISKPEQEYEGPLTLRPDRKESLGPEARSDPEIVHLQLRRR